MELSVFKGNIVGVIGDKYNKDDYKDEIVRNIIMKKAIESLKMVKLDESVLDARFSDLSASAKSKVILASKLHDKEIVLHDFSEYMTYKEMDYFKSLFKKISTYNRRIILFDKNMEMFLNCVDKIYVVNNGEVKYETDNIFDKVLELYGDVPKIVRFIFECERKGVRLDYYTQLDELLKAIYRIKS